MTKIEREEKIDRLWGMIQEARIEAASIQREISESRVEAHSLYVKLGNALGSLKRLQRVVEG